MSAKAVVVKDTRGPVVHAEVTLNAGWTFPLTNKDGYTIYPASLSAQSAYVKVFADGYKPYLQLVSLDGNNQEIHIGGDPNFGPPNTIHLPPLSFKRPLLPPSREEVCNGQTTQQGLYVRTIRYGQMPWWGACWAWLDTQSRQEAAQQLLLNGDTICLIGVPSGGALYPEPNQFYSEDKFPPLSSTPAQIRNMVEEALDLGFTAVWLFLGGDDGGTVGFPIAVAQAQALGPILEDLLDYVMVVPGWDGVWYGYTPDQVAMFSFIARSEGFQYVGIEHSTGHLLAGGQGDEDYREGGKMVLYDTILGEFNSGQFDATVWQILGRMIDPYLWPPDQPLGSDYNPAPKLLAPGSPRGPYYYVVFEYGIYAWVRGTLAATIHQWRDYFRNCGASNVC